MKYILIPILLCIFNLSVTAVTFKTIEDKKGRTIRVEILEITESTITFIRVNEYRKHTIPLDLLSEKSKKEIQNPQGNSSKFTHKKLTPEELTPEEFWITNIKKAKEKARTENKNILLNFTGSDWCGWCVKLEKDVFEKSKFKKYAQNKLVMVKLDYPRKDKQSTQIKKQNKKLKSEYKIAGYPNILLITPQGKVLGKITGYPKEVQNEGLNAYIERIENIIKN